MKPKTVKRSEDEFSVALDCIKILQRKLIIIDGFICKDRTVQELQITVARLQKLAEEGLDETRWIMKFLECSSEPLEVE